MAPILIAGLLAGLLLAGCAVNPVTGESELSLVSEESELELGRKVYPALRWEDGGPLQLDAGTQGYLAGIVQRLHAVSHRPKLPVDFTLSSASVPNAWAIPGHTAVNRGLLQTLENEAQFAFVMGHEMGHVAARHSAQRQTYGLLGEFLLGAAGLVVASQTSGSSRIWGELALGAGGVATSLALLRYDRSQELEADRLGVLYMARAGYDPREAARAHQRLERAVDQYLANLGRRREEPGALGELLSTHPRQEVRLAEVEQMMRELPPGEARLEGDGRHAERWLARTAGIRALGPAYARYDRSRLALRQDRLGPAREEVAAAISQVEQAPFWTLQGAILVKEGRPGEAQQSYSRALALYPGYQPALHGLGVTESAQGRVGGAIGYLGESLKLRPGYAPSAYLLGLAYTQTGRDREAIPYLQAVAEANPRHPEVNGLLARAYERAGDRRAAYGAWQAQVVAAPGSELGREGRQRLQVLSASLSRSYSGVGVRMELPLAWEIARERSSKGGGEVEVKRDGPPVTLRVGNTDVGAPAPELRARLDELVQRRLGSVRAGRETSGFRLGGRTTLARWVEYRRGGSTVEHLFAVAARGTRVYTVDVMADAATWRDAARGGEIRRVLDSLAF